MSPLRSSLLPAAGVLLLVSPAAAECFADSGTLSHQPADVVLRSAQSDLASGRWDAAAKASRFLSVEGLDPVIGAQAATLYLESVAHVDVVPSECSDVVASDVRALHRRYCRGDDPTKHVDLCAELARHQFEQHGLELHLVSQSASLARSEAEAASIRREAATRWIESFRELCEEPAKHGVLRPPDRCEAVAVSAAYAFRTAHALGKAIEAYRHAIAFDDVAHTIQTGTACADGPCASRQHSPAMARAFEELGEAYETLGVFDAAADWYEQYGTVAPQGPDAMNALSKALQLRLRLGRIDEARAGVRTFLETFRKSPAESVQVVLTLATYHAERQDWPRAREALVPVMARLDRAPLDLQLQVHALLGRAGAPEHHAWVRAAYKPGTLASRIRAEWPSEDDAQHERRIALALDAIGAAFFASAEAIRLATMEPLKPPARAGPPYAPMMKPWYERRLAATVAAEREYQKILGLGLSPPSEWVILASARIALMWTDFVDAFERRTVTGSLAVRSATFAAIDRIAEPLKAQRAKPAALQCIALASKLRQSTEDPRGPRACATWLAKSYKAEHHLVDEIIVLLGSPDTWPPPLRW